MSDIQKEALLARIDSALDTIRPHLVVDGGNVEVVEVTDDMHLRVRWVGACQNCNMSHMTMKAGVEHAVRNLVPEIMMIEAVE